MPGSVEESQAGARLIVAASEAGLRLDGFLTRRDLVPSTAAARRALASGLVRVNGRLARKGCHLQPGDVVDMGEGKVRFLAVEPAPELALSVLYSDDLMVAVDKPAHLASHPLRPGEGATVAGALVARFPECASASPDAREGGLVHRLDIGTSGVLLAARTREAWYRLRAALAAPSCVKLYLALVRGQFPGPDEIPHDRAGLVVPGPRPSSFVVTVPIGRRGRRGRKVVLGAGRGPLPARTEIAFLEERPGGALVEASLSRGRAHQVRAHLAFLHLPVAGDTLYGEPEDAAGLHLHARALSLPHPSTGEPLRIEALLPAWARRLG